ncbi:hypothetical protein EV182_005954, partial [Spiromyces aspiralis]
MGQYVELLNHEWEYECIERIRVLEDLPRADKAMRLLRAVVDEAHPTMKKYRMNAYVVTEFYPADITLQGLNKSRGYEIFLRLRDADDPCR